MLTRMSAFVLETLPFLLSGAIAAVLLPAFLFSRVHGPEARTMPEIGVFSENALPVADRTPPYGR
jgi:hypothetical protein